MEPGFFHSDNLATTREYLHTQGYVPRVSVTHKRELRKLVVQLGTGRLVIAREPAHAGEIAEFCAHFGLEYRGASLCAAVGSVLEQLLKPSAPPSARSNTTRCMRPKGTDAMYVTQNLGWGRTTATMWMF